jgi:hypothetical protein
VAVLLLTYFYLHCTRKFVICQHPHNAAIGRLKINANFITAILRRDAKDTTYKFALLRGLVQVITVQMAHKRISENVFSGMGEGVGLSNGVSLGGITGDSGTPILTGGPLRTAPYLYRYPLGLLVWYWLQYYYPLFEHSAYIPQKNGESSRMEKGKTMAIRRHFDPVISYYASKGGFAQLYFDLLRDQVPAEVATGVRNLLREIAAILIKMPMHHLGFSVFYEPYSLVNARKGRIIGLSYSALLKEAGDLYIHPELHEVIDALGGLLVGEDSILSGWASFTASISRRSEDVALVSEDKILSLLRADPIGDRDVLLARKVFEQTSQRCVWSGSPADIRHIDHMLPFSLTRNNSLWNLAPVTPAVNSQKSDKIPAPELVSRSAGRIGEVWKQFESSYEALFWQEVYEGLGIAKEAGVDGAIESLQKRCTYLIQTRGMEAFRG